MKSFLQLVEEQDKAHKPVVMAFGRMNPPTTGHLKLIDKVREVAKKQKAEHTVIVSHSQDSKKNPLSGEQKVKHLKRYSPGTNFDTSSKEHPSIFHHAAKLHAAGHDHLTVVAGSDRVKEFHDALHKYNGVHGKHGYYNFKKISVVSAGARDPDAEGAEGMSGTKMREHAKNNDFNSFRQGVPSHVPDKHAKELMHDTRKGMGLHEDVNRGRFKAIFVTGGPGSGKDIIIRESIAESRIVELNFIQAFDYLTDKQKLSEKSNDYRRESIRTRGPLIVNGPADDVDKISYIKEELEELGYDTMMVFVNTSNETSKVRNSLLSRMMSESVRQDKWMKSQENGDFFMEKFSTFISFDNTGNIDTIEEDITNVYQSTKMFLDEKDLNESASTWLDRNLNINDKINSLFKENKNVKENAKENSKSIQKANLRTKGCGKHRFLADSTCKGCLAVRGPADVTPDNRGGATGPYGDSIKGNTFPRKNPNGTTYTFGAGAGVYAEAKTPTIKVSPTPKEFNFQKDANTERLKKFGDKSLSASRVGKPSGIGPEYDTRAGGQGAAAGAGLGLQTYSESQEYSNAQPSSAALPGSSALQPNPLSNSYDVKKDFSSFRKKIKKEAIDDPGANDMGVYGVLGGAGNKEGMDTYKDPMRNIGITIKKKKKFNEDHVKELENGLHELDKYTYQSINKLMQSIAKRHDITGKDLHDDFKDKHNKTPDDWIKNKK